MVQLPHTYTTTGKTIALTIRTFVSKVMLTVAERSHPEPEARGGAGRSNPTSKERWLGRRRRA